MFKTYCAPEKGKAQNSDTDTSLCMANNCKCYIHYVSTFILQSPFH